MMLFSTAIGASAAITSKTSQYSFGIWVYESKGWVDHLKQTTTHLQPAPFLMAGIVSHVNRLAAPRIRSKCTFHRWKLSKQKRRDSLRTRWLFDLPKRCWAPESGWLEFGIITSFHFRDGLFSGVMLVSGSVIWTSFGQRNKFHECSNNKRSNPTKNWETTSDRDLRFAKTFLCRECWCFLFQHPHSQY